MTFSENHHAPLKGVYRPGLSSIERLKKTGVGQQEIFAELTKALEDSAGKHSPDHTLFIGPPGIGKTHLLKLLNDKIARSRLLMNSYRLIMFPVDNHRITSLVFFLLELVKNLAESDKEGQWADLLIKCEDQETAFIRKHVINALKKAYKDTGRRFLVLFENFDAFFKNPKKKEEIVDEFSEFLSDCGPVTFIGSATTFVADSALLKCRPYSQFNIHLIKELTLDQTRKLVRNHLKYDQQREMLSRFDDLTPKIHALHQLTGGNPRLIMLLYELLTDESTKNIKSLFEDLLDRVTPYYQERIRSLSSTDRAFLATLTSMRTGDNTLARLSKTLRITTLQCSTIVNRLLSDGYLEFTNHPNDKRTKIYRIREGFFDLWLAIGQLKDPKRFLPFLAEFLEKWYSDKTARETKRQQLWLSLQVSEAGEISDDIENAETLLNYLANIGNNEERSQNQLELAYYFATIGRKQKSRKLLKSTANNESNNPVFKWVSTKIRLLLKDAIANGFNQQLHDLFDCWKYERSRIFEKVVSQAVKISSYFDLNSEHELNIAFLARTIDLVNNDAYRLPLYARIAGSQEKKGHLDGAVASWKKVLKITDDTRDQKSKGTTLNNLSQVYQDQGKYIEAMDYLEQALEILQEINDYDGQSTTLNNIATVYFAQGYYEKALEYFEKTLSIIHYTNDFPLKAITLSNISFIYKVRGEHENAISNLEQSLSIMRKTGNRNGEATTLINISQIYGDLGDLELCYRYFKPAIQILEENRENQSACNALLNFGIVFWKHDSREMALSSWWLLKKIAQEHNLSADLEKLEKLMQSLEIEELNPSSAFS